MYALVKNKKVITTTQLESFEWDGYTHSNITLMSYDEKKLFGIYEIIHRPTLIKDTQRLIGSTMEYNEKDDVVYETPIIMDKSKEELQRETNIVFQNAILNSEALITPRRLREAVLTEQGKEWLIAQELLIKEKRDQLV